MKILNAAILEDDFVLAFNELLKIDMPAKQCLEVNQSIDEIVTHYYLLKKTQVTIAAKYAVLDEKENITFGSDGKVVFKSKEDEDKCQKEIMEIRNEHLEIPLTKKIKIYEDAIITPRKILLLQEVIDVVEREVPKSPVSQK